MTGKEALETLKKISVCGYDSNERDYYYSGRLDDVYDEEVNAIEKDLDLLCGLKLVLSHCLSDYNTETDTIEAIIKNDFDTMFFKSLLNKLGYDLIEK